MLVDFLIEENEFEKHDCSIVGTTELNPQEVAKKVAEIIFKIV